MQGRTETAEQKRWGVTKEVYGEEEIEAISPLSHHGQLRSLAKNAVELRLVRGQWEYWWCSLMCLIDMAAPEYT